MSAISRLQIFLSSSISVRVNKSTNPSLFLKATVVALPKPVAVSAENFARVNKLANDNPSILEPVELATDGA